MSKMPRRATKGPGEREWGDGKSKNQRGAVRRSSVDRNGWSRFRRKCDPAWEEGQSAGHQRSGGGRQSFVLHAHQQGRNQDRHPARQVEQFNSQKLEAPAGVAGGQSRANGRSGKDQPMKTVFASALAISFAVSLVAISRTPAFAESKQCDLRNWHRKTQDGAKFEEPKRRADQHDALEQISGRSDIQAMSPTFV
ncbi:hypothetical protein V3H18_11265 [Methylocystis sp. 9N]|uniref:Uncharacterized protein n=1 Tax=Methylocystis borbori TaxID=3118750 RepID=A0ABU7XI96_9HYPH